MVSEALGHAERRCLSGHLAEGRTRTFVGNEDAGNNVAGLYSFVAACEANDVNPLDYLVDVMRRIQDHPAVAIDDILPHHWKAGAA